MANTVTFKHSQGSLDGSREKPYQAGGGIRFDISYTGAPIAENPNEFARWVNLPKPCPNFGYRIDWTNREGNNAVCTPAPNHQFDKSNPAILEIGVTVKFKDGDIVTKSDRVYVWSPRCAYSEHNPKPEPEPSPEPEPDPQPEPDPPKPSGHPVICSDGTVYLGTYNFTFLLGKGKIGNAGGKTYFNGSKAELEAIVKVIPPEPKPEPPDSDEDPPVPMEYRYFLPLRVVDEVDSGIYLSAAEKAEVKLSIFKHRVPSSDEGELQDVKSITLGTYNVLARMVRGDWHIQEADSALVVSDVPLACCSVWVTKDNNVQYTGFPGLEA